MYFNSGGVGEDSLSFRNIENLPPKRNGIHNLDLKRIGKENSESAAISVDSIDANAEKKLLQEIIFAKRGVELKWKKSLYSLKK